MTAKQKNTQVVKVNRPKNQLPKQTQKQSEDTGLVGFLKSLTYGIMYSPEEGKVDVKVADRSKDRDVSVTFRQGSGKDTNDTKKRKKLETKG